MNKLIFILTSIATLFMVSCNNANFKSPKETFTPIEVAEMLKGNVLMVDVRNANEVAQQAYDVKNIINIPLDNLETNMNKIPKDKQVILVCQSGNRSGKAYELLKKEGFTNIANMEGGMKAWIEAGLPTKSNEALVNGDKKACCADPNSKDCNADGTCKTNTDTKACCADPNSKDCNPDGTCKTDTKVTSNNNDKMYVYAFHGTNQCTTCKNMKANTKATLDTYFAEELKTGKIVFQIVDVDDKKNEKLAEKFEATGTALMINQVKGGKEKIIDLSDMAFEKANDKALFVADLKSKINGLQ